MAKSSIIGNLVVVAEVDTSGLKRGLDQAQANMKKFGRAANDNITNSMSGMASAVGMASASLGAIGVAAGIAAAAIAGIIVVASKAREALNFFDDLGDTATKLRVSAEAMQEWRFAAEEANLKASDFDDSIQGLQSSVGKFVSGIGGARVAKAFEALGISREQAASFKSVSDMLPLLADRLQAVGSEAEKVAIADKLNLRPLLPLLEQGSAKIEEMVKKFRQLGMEIDNKTVESMGDLQRQAELASQAIDINLKQAFIGISPIIVNVTKFIAGVSRELSGYLSLVSKVKDRSQSQLEWEKARLLKEKERLQSSGNWNSGLVANSAFEKNAKKLAEVNDGLIRLGGFDSKYIGKYAPVKDPNTQKTFMPNQRSQAAAMAKIRVKTNGPLTGEDGEVAPLTSGGGFSAINRSIAAQGRALQAARDEALRKAEMAMRTSDLPIPKGYQNLKVSLVPALSSGLQSQIADMNAAIANVTEGLAGTWVEAFTARQDEIRDQLSYAIRGGLEAAIHGGGKGLMTYLADAFKERMIENMANGLTDLVQNSLFSTGGGKTKGSSLFDKLAGIAASVFHVPGFAVGTSYAPGGLALVGERGPELVNLPRGSRVHTAAQTAGMGGVTQIFHVNAQGSVLASDLMNEMRQVGFKAAMAGAQGGANLARYKAQRDGRDRFY